jgi:3-oxoadipate enol-lactonase
MDGKFWAPVTERLKAICEVIAVDCRGHGSSEKPVGAYAVEQFADDIAAVIAQAGWDKAVVAGASMGGCVALAFAARHPNLCAGLGLFDTTAWYGADAPAQWNERAQKAQDQGLASLVEFQKTRWFGDTFRSENPEIVEQCVATFLRNDTAAYAQTCRMLGGVDLRPALKTVHVPTRIALGEEDYATPPAMAQVMHAAIEGSTLNIIANGRHFTPLEHPDGIAGELRQLIEVAYR